MPSNCRLCHGPIASAQPPSPLISSSAQRNGVAAPQEIELHAHCMPFACPSCVAHDKPSYALINLQNEVYDYNCNVCMGFEAEPLAQLIVPPSHANTSKKQAPATLNKGNTVVMTTIVEVPEASPVGLCL